MPAPWERYAQQQPQPQQAGPWQQYQKQREFVGPLQEQPKAPQPSVMSRVGRTAGLGVRSLYNAVAAIPNMVHDVPAAISNIVTGTNYPTAAQQQNEAMTRLGLPSPETTTEKVGDFATQLVAGFAMGEPINKAILGSAGLANVPSVIRTPAQQVFANAQREGMVVPPAQVAPRSAGALLEGMGGTLKTGQQAAARNQPVINALAARAVGVSDEALSPELLQSIRTQAGNAYRVIRSVGEVTTDDDFIRAVQAAAKPFRNTQGAFPTLAKANESLIAIADDVAKKSFDADAAVDAIQMLRDHSGAAYRAGFSSQGGAYKSMANAMEAAIERHLTRLGDGGSQVLGAFRNARQLIAKTHTVEDALKGSNVDINALGRMLKNGVPMTDELKLLGQFSQYFPGAANLTAALKARPAYSPLDAMTAVSSLAGAGVAGQLTNPGVAATLAAPAAYAISRPAARGLALSPLVQNSLSRGPTSIPWRNGLYAAPAAVNALKDKEQRSQQR